MKGKMIAIEMVAIVLFVFAAVGTSYGQRCSYDGKPVECAREIQTGTVRQSTMPSSESSPAAQYYNGVPCSRAKRITAGLIGGGLVGGVVGGLAGGNRKWLGIGAAVGSGAVAAGSIRTPKGCEGEEVAQNSRDRNRMQYAQYTPTIASADAPEPTSMSGPAIQLRNVYGANRTMLETPVQEAAAHLGYGFLDSAYYNPNQNNQSVAWLMDIIVNELSYVNGQSGSNYGMVSFFVSHSRSAGRIPYQVSIKMIDARTMLIDPSRSVTYNVSVPQYANSYGNFTVYNFNGYSGGSYQAANPATAAAEEVIKTAFGLVGR